MYGMNSKRSSRQLAFISRLYNIILYSRHSLTRYSFLYSTLYVSYCYNSIYRDERASRRVDATWICNLSTGARMRKERTRSMHIAELQSDFSSLTLCCTPIHINAEHKGDEISYVYYIYWTTLKQIMTSSAHFTIILYSSCQLCANILFAIQVTQHCAKYFVYVNVYIIAIQDTWRFHSMNYWMTSQSSVL